MDIKRRHMLTDPGDSLLLSKSSVVVFERFSTWREETGMDPSEFTFDTLCSVPIPTYPEVSPGERRFAGVRPEAMWHPLFWLPSRVSGQYKLPEEPGGELRPEPTTVRSARIALEVNASGLYDDDTGTWVDILDTVGIDVDSPEDLNRIAAWQAGGIDDALDSINLSSYLTLENQPNWAIESALSLLDTLEQAQCALLADSLIDQLFEVTAPEDGLVDFEKLRSEMALVSMLASLHLDEVDGGAISSSDFWQDLETSAKEGTFLDVEAFLDGPVSNAMTWLHETREAYWPAVVELQGAPVDTEED